MSDATTIWLVRHGLPDGVTGRCHGRLDVPLSAEGIVQAKKTAARLAHEDIGRLWRGIGVIADPFPITPFKPYVRCYRIRLTDDLTGAACAE